MQSPNKPTDYIDEEYTRQYKRLTIALVLGILGVPAVPIFSFFLNLIGYLPAGPEGDTSGRFINAVLTIAAAATIVTSAILRASLRRRLAEMGKDPAAIAAPVKGWVSRSVVTAAITAAFLVAVAVLINRVPEH